MLKRLLSSRLLRLIFSAVLIYFAFRKVDVVSIVGELGKVPIWVVVVMLGYSFINIMIGAYRWALLLIDKPSLKDILRFTRSIYLGSFYGLFFPSSVGMDLTKWVSLMKHYPQFSKTNLVGSVVVDRIVGFSAFITVAFMSILLGKYYKFNFPPFLFWLFLGLFVGMVVFYFVIFTFNVVGFLGRIKFLLKVSQIVELLRAEHMRRILKCIAVSFVSELMWMIATWFYGLIFGANISILSVFIFIPIIALVLVLPISIAGFGARETLFLYFFAQTGIAHEKILLVSTFTGIISVASSLLGGLWSLF